MQGGVACRADARVSSPALPVGAQQLPQRAEFGDQRARHCRRPSGPRCPRPSSSASSSASESACAPRSSSFSRGRSDFGQSRMPWLDRASPAPTVAGAGHSVVRSAGRLRAVLGSGAAVGEKAGVARNRIIPTGCLRGRGVSPDNQFNRVNRRPAPIRERPCKANAYCSA